MGVPLEWVLCGSRQLAGITASAGCLFLDGLLLGDSSLPEVSLRA